MYGPHAISNSIPVEASRLDTTMDTARTGP